MAVALTTTEPEDAGDEFSPGGEFALQVSSAAFVAGLVIDVEAAVDDEADFATLYSWRLAEGAIKRFAAQHRVRVRVRRNTAGNTVSVRRSA